MRILLLAALIGITAQASASTIEQLAVVNTNIKVEGRAYRVWIKGKIGKVYSKAAIVRPDAAMADQMERALRDLTGCELTEHVWVDAHLEGIVRCPASAQAAK